jgi:hypothetical protein
MKKMNQIFLKIKIIKEKANKKVILIDDFFCFYMSNNTTYK